MRISDWSSDVCSSDLPISTETAMHWRVKGIIQKVLGTIPGGAMLHFHLQRRFGGLRSFERELSVKVDDWAIMARHLRNAGVDFSRMRGFEIGTGWYPTFPFACYLAGARKIKIGRAHV